MNEFETVNFKSLFGKASIGNIIKNSRVSKNMSMYALAESAGVTAQYINDIEKNKKRTPPTDETLIRIAQSLNMDENEQKLLLTLAALEKTPNLIKEELKEFLPYLFQTKIDNSNAEIIDANISRIPVFSYVRAGYDGGCIELPEPVEYIDLPVKKNGCEIIAIKVKGDSMEPRLYEGDIVIVKMGIEPNNKEPGVFITADGETIVKIYNILPDGRKILTSLNSIYPPIYDNFNIVGKVWKVLGGW